MCKKHAVLIVFFCLLQSVGLFAQETLYHSKKILVTRDTITIDSVSINQSFFAILDKNQEPIAPNAYTVDFAKSKLVFQKEYANQDTLTVRYLKFPDFLTKEYSIYNKSRVVSNNGLASLYKTSKETFPKFQPFDGLSTSGSITRGITVGNNQNTSVASNLDLQITGKLSDKVSLRASLQDSNIPLQEGGYSQKLDEFDQIFIELFSDTWSIRAGDLFLENRKSRFLNFNKKVQGLATKFTFGKPDHKTEVFASGAIVRGQYAKSVFIGKEGNQGPYKLKGPNGELFILVISGSERVYVNGVLLTRGENNQYIIDYNAGEVTFTSLYPITSEMRIAIEYQFSDRNYTRFVTYAGASHESSTWQLSGALYSENDVKNQPVQQNLSPEQVQILANAGDDATLMNAPSAVLDTFSENKILYKKSLVGTETIFEYSTNASEVLYTVKFTFLGANKGNYVLKNAIANGRIYEYIAPIAGIPQGSYEPIVPLIAPTKTQVATLIGKYMPHEKTVVDFEVAVSNFDKNLFSSISDKDNQGVASKLNFKQRLFSKKWQLATFGNLQWIQKNYKSIERINTIEFDRDWNLNNPTGNQSLFITGLQLELPNVSLWKYQLENLNFSKQFSGNRHLLTGYFKNQAWLITNDGSFLTSNGNLTNSKFLRNKLESKYHFKRNWVGSSFRMEDNQEKNASTNQFTTLSQRFKEYGAFIGRGDSTKVFAELGYLHRVNDSLQLGNLIRVNSSQSYFLKSRLVQNATRDLSVFINYRNLKFQDNRGNSPSLNSRILYNDNYFLQKIQVTTVYENNSGTIAQQEFSFLEVEPGKGVYAWNDYNNNGIQELQEFEIAPFPDQAKYVKIFLPNQIYIPTHQNKFSQAINLNPSGWINAVGFRKFLSHFYNQSSYLVERKIKREGNNFDLNPFAANSTNLLGLSTSIRNSLFFNRAKQYHSVTYTFLSNSVKSLLVSDVLQNNNISHQLQYVHLLQKSWLFTVSNRFFKADNTSLNYASRNYNLNGNVVQPKVGYLFSKNASWDVFYILQNKQNTIGVREALRQTVFGSSFTVASEKQLSLNGEFSYIDNRFTGNAFSPVGFQMLEGLQPGKNTTWRLLFQKNLTQFLDVNVNYQGRKSETTKTIHTGNIQLRAYF